RSSTALVRHAGLLHRDQPRAAPRRAVLRLVLQPAAHRADAGRADCSSARRHPGWLLARRARAGRPGLPPPAHALRPNPGAVLCHSHALVLGSVAGLPAHLVRTAALATGTRPRPVAAFAAGFAPGLG